MFFGGGGSSHKLGLNFLIVAGVKILKEQSMVSLQMGRGQEKWAGSYLYSFLIVCRNKQWKLNSKKEKGGYFLRGNVLLFSLV